MRTPTRVRMGLHTGEPVVTDEGYVGIDVHRAARIAAAAHGGQVLVSRTTRDLLEDDIQLRDLGEHRLKDLTAPQRIYQLGVNEFPPLKTLNQSNLPVQPTPLIGRSRELADVLERHAIFLERSGLRHGREVARARQEILETAQRLLVRGVSEGSPTGALFDRLANAVADRETDPHAAARKLLESHPKKKRPR